MFPGFRMGSLYVCNLRNSWKKTWNLPTSSTTRHFSSESSSAKNERKLKELRDRIIRVDHAGEYGANRIYAGQMAVLGMSLIRHLLRNLLEPKISKIRLFLSGNTKSGPLIQHMWDQEKEHLRIFESLMPKYRARPTVLLPIWNVAGFALGAGQERH